MEAVAGLGTILAILLVVFHRPLFQRGQRRRRSWEWSPINVLAVVVLVLIALALVGVVGCEANVTSG